MYRTHNALTLLEILMVVVIIALVAVISIPSIIAVKKAANEGSAQTSLKTIVSSENLFREADSDENEILDYGTLAGLSGQNLIDTSLGSGTKAGYTFRVQPSATSPTLLWFATAQPTVPTKTGDRYFVTNQAGVVFFTTGSAIPFDTITCAIPAGTRPVE